MTSESKQDSETPNGPDLSAFNDAALIALVDDARAILAARETERRKEALAQIKAIAKAHGMTVNVQGKGKGKNAGRSKRAA